MPFDGTDFHVRREEPARRSAGERAFCLLFLFLAVCALVTPITMAALVDIVRYFRG